MQRYEGYTPKQVLYLALQAKIQRLLTDQLRIYVPYPKQKLFHSLGADKRERLLRAGNQNGKTFAGGMEMAIHTTGIYPDWWTGRRWDRPIIAWAASDTGETTRDNPQRALLGLLDDLGTGAIPKRLLGPKKTAIGTADLLDYIKIRHASGGYSVIRFKHYSQGRAKWQGPPIDLIWYDEEPPADIYSEGSARLILDTHLGSGSSAIAAHYFGCDFVGCELDAKYYQLTKERFDRETAQVPMFG